MAARRFNTGNLVAGFFLLGGLALAVWVSFMLSERSGFGKTIPFTVRFSLSDGATGLKKGSAVLLGGQAIGRVTGVKVAYAAASGEGAGGGGPRATGIDVQVETSAEVALYENAEVYLQLPLLGTLSSINFAGIGDPAKVTEHQHASAAIEAGDVIRGKIAPPAFLAQAGFGSAEAEALRSAIKGMESGVTKFSAVVDKVGPEIEATLGDVRSITKDLRTGMDSWTGKIETTLKNVEAASGRLDPMLTKVDKSLDAASATVAETRVVIAENRANLDSIMKSVASAADKIDKQTVDAVNGAIKNANSALEKFSATLERVNTVAADATPTIRNMLANANLAAEQIKLVAVEVRSQPWRLLVQPDKRELETELLYDAARSYAEAATNLKTLSDSLQSVSAAGANKEAVAALTTQLTESMGRFRKAEEAFLDRLIGKQKK